MKVTGVLETSLYVDDVPRAAEFYHRLFGFDKLQGDNRFCALNVVGKQVLLLFKKGGTREPVLLPGGVLPPHDGSGTTHLAFSIPTEDFVRWETRLAEHGVTIESRVSWPLGGRSIYFRDPDGHLLELITPGCWATY